MKTKAKRGKRSRHRWRSAFAAACAARLATGTPAVQAGPVIVFGPVINQVTGTSPTDIFNLPGGFPFTDAQYTFELQINNPNPFGGNYRFYTDPSGSLDSSNSWDFGDYIVEHVQSHFPANNSQGDRGLIIDSNTTMPVTQPLPVSTDSVVFGYLGKTFINNSLTLVQGKDAYTVDLGTHTYAETIAGFFGQPAAASVTLNLGGTYLSTKDARLEGQSVIVQGSGVFQTNGSLFVAGNVTVKGGTLAAQTVEVDNDNDYLSQGEGSGAPHYGTNAPTSTVLTLDGANAKITTNNVFVADQSTNGPATLILQNSASVMTAILEAANAANTDGRIVVNNGALSVTNFADIAVEGHATMTIEGGGKVTVTGNSADANLTLGFETGSNGTLTVTDANSSLKTDGSLLVGGGGATGGGAGTAFVENGATVTTKDTLIVGNSGAATDAMTISSGAVVTSSAASGTASDFSGVVGTSVFSGTATADIVGGGAAWINKQSISIGAGGTGLVTVLDGGTLEVDGSTVEIGHNSSGTGTLTFAKAGGANPTFTFNGGATNQLIIGDAGTGHFFVQGGAQITVGASVIIGNQGDTGSGAGTGDATVMESNSSLTITGNLTVGKGGTGTLTIMDGDTVSVGGTGILGDQNGSKGTLTLDGAGSKLTFTASGNTLMIGNHGTGTLMVQDGASVTLPATALGQQTDGSGNIIVNGKSADGTATSSVTITGKLTIGLASGAAQNQSNSLTISGGGNVMSGQTVIGDQAGSFGMAQISGQNSQWTVSNSSGSDPDLTVGASGRGVFDLSNHASFTAGDVTLGAKAPSGNNAGGTITIEGATGGGSQTMFKTTAELIIGDAGIGNFTASGGAQVVSSDKVTIANQSTSTASMATITDPGTRWTISGDPLTIGNGGSGFLTVQNGATVDASNARVFLGVSMNGPNSQGTLTVTGANSTFKAASLDLGDSGSQGLAALGVAQGGQANITGMLSASGNGSDTIFVDGKSSSGTPSQLTVGQMNLASPLQFLSITVSNQGILTVKNTGMLTVDGVAAGSETITITSGGQVNASQSSFNLGVNGNGTLNVTGGGSFTSSDSTIGGGSRPSVATIEGGSGAPSTWNIVAGSGEGALTVNASGTLTINQGGSVTVAGSLTEAADDTAVITVNGANAVLTVNGQSSAANGRLNVMGGGVVNVAGLLTIGDTAMVTGSGSTLSAENLTITGSHPGTPGDLTLSNSARADVTKTVTVAAHAVLFVQNGGGMNIGALASAADGQIVIGPGGTLKDFGGVTVGNVVVLPFGSLGGSGTVNLTLVSNLGLVAPGDPQTFTINGSYAQGSTGTLQLQIAGTGAANSDHLVVTGQATLGGFLELDFINGFAPQAGDVFSLLTFGSTAGQFAGVEVTGLAPGWTFTLNPTGTTFSLTSTSNGVFSPEFVVPPGPNTLLAGVLPNQTVHFTGGILEAATNSTLPNPVTLDLAGGLFQADAGTFSTLSGVISGPGLLTKIGPGTLTLTGNNLYLGGTAINGGVLAIFSDANLGAAGTSVSFDGGTLQTLANFTTSRAITLNAGGGIFDTNGFDANLDGVISGVGGLTKLGAGSLFLEAKNTYTGTTVVEEGTLFLDGSVAGDVAVFAPGILGGNGSIGGSLFNAGVVSPGHSPGALQVSGNYTQSSAGLLKIEIGGLGAGQHDVLAVGGAATLDGAVQLVQLNGFKFERNESVTFLTAGGGVAGKFSMVLNDFTSDSILQPTVVYGPNSVALEVVQGSFAGFAANAGLTPNQRAVAAALDTLPTNSRKTDALFNYLDFRALAKLPGDFDKISPEGLTSVFTIGTSLAQVQTDNLQRRTADLRGGASGFNAANLSLNGDGPSYSGGFGISAGVAGPAGEDGKESKTVREVAPDDRLGVFLSGTGQWVSVGDTSNARGYDLQSGGFTLGVDYKVTPNFAIGVSAGYTGSTSDLADRGRISVNGGKLGIYATYFTGGFYTDMAVNGGYNNYTNRRSALEGQARGDSDGGELNGLFGTGYDFKKGALTFGPTANFNYTYLGTGDFTEHGSLAPLDVHGGKGESLRTAIGFKASYEIKVGKVVVKPEIRAAWQHEYGDAVYALDSNFANAGGGAFTVSGPRIGRDSALIGAGVAVQFSDRVSAYVYYDGDLGRRNYESNSVTGGFSVAF